MPKVYVKPEDTAALKAAGFKPSFSEATWFGVDKQGRTWQAYEGYKQDRMQFRITTDTYTGSFEPMSYTDFASTFNLRD